jgi:hypothetical protein
MSRHIFAFEISAFLVNLSFRANNDSRNTKTALQTSTGSECIGIQGALGLVHAFEGGDVFALGFPADTNLGISEGIISHVYDDKPPVPDYKWQVQHSILINGGNSGGPTVNRKGVAIGISTWKQLRSYTTDAQVEGMNFSVNVHRLLETARDTSTLDEVNLTGVFSRLAARAVEEAKFGN